MNWSEWVILGILGVFSIRDIIAAFGNIPRNNKWYSKLIYGNYDENLIAKVLSDWGYNDNTIAETNRTIRKASKQWNRLSIPNVLPRLVFLLSKYTVKFSNKVTYSLAGNSNYYIDTMESATNTNDLNEMSDLMVHLIKSTHKKLPDIIAVPKGGNVELAQYIAMKYGIKFVVVKDSNDASRARAVPENEECYKINIEGSWDLFTGKRKDLVLIDCNATSGLQLINAINVLNGAIECGMKVNKITDAYVLFHIDDEIQSIDELFSSNQCTLHRYIDIDEECKEQLYTLKKNHIKKASTVYDKKIKQEISLIIQQSKTMVGNI